MKRLVVAALGAAIVLPIAGCGSSSDTSAPAAAPVTAAVATPALQSSKVLLVDRTGGGAKRQTLSVQTAGAWNLTLTYTCTDPDVSLFSADLWEATKTRNVVSDTQSGTKTIHFDAPGAEQVDIHTNCTWTAKATA